MALQFPFFAVGLIGIFSTRHRLRTMMRPHGVIVPTWREVAERIPRRQASLNNRNQNRPSGSWGWA